MFPYFGSKHEFIGLYPEPAYPLIIEPFAGSARYSLRYWDREIWLNDYDWRIPEIWRYLQSASLADIDALPDIQPGDYLSGFPLSRPQRLLLSYAVNRGSGHPANKYQGWAAENGDVRLLKERWKKHLEHTRHWRITNLSYSELPNIEATWFIDPPYQFGGKNYRHNQIAYPALAEWCKSRKGQVIVCENDFADWLPFKPLIVKKVNRSGVMRNITECVWLQGSRTMPTEP